MEVWFRLDNSNLSILFFCLTFTKFLENSENLPRFDRLNCQNRQNYLKMARDSKLNLSFNYLTAEKNYQIMPGNCTALSKWVGQIPARPSLLVGWLADIPQFTLGPVLTGHRKEQRAITNFKCPTRSKLRSNFVLGGNGIFRKFN